LNAKVLLIADKKVSHSVSYPDIHFFIKAF